MTMTRRGIKVISLLLAALFVVCALPQASLAALPADLEVAETSGFTSATAAPALADGQVWVNRSASSNGLVPEAQVTLSALGQAYNAPKASIVANNIVFVLDVSGSMANNSKASNMVNAANAAAEALCVNGNKVGVVLFSQNASATVERSLDETPFRLTTSDTDESDPNLVKILPNGGTNIQAGLNRAYLELVSKSSDGANPIIILLSDGAPTYHYQNVKGFRYNNTSSGNGSDTRREEIAVTAVQAAYLKTQWNKLKIYTIGFDVLGNKSAIAALNPTSQNIEAYDALYGDGGWWTGSGRNKVWVPYTLASELNDAREAYASLSSMNYSYADGFYEASNDISSLNRALSAISRSIEITRPVLESTAGTAGDSDTAYVVLNDQIGENYILGPNMNVNYGGASYPFAYNSSTGEIKYTAKSTDQGYNARMNELLINYKSSSRTLTWKIPGSMLPCRNPGGSGDITPILLQYNIVLDGNDLTEGIYPTSAKFTYSFTPTPDNPKYTGSQTEQEATYPVSTQATYYEATFEQGASGTRSLWSFASGQNPNSLTYVSNPSSYSGAYTHSSSPKLTMTIGGQPVQLTTIKNMEIAVTLRYKAVERSKANRQNINNYLIESFVINGSFVYTDARIVSIQAYDNNVNRDFVISYNGGSSIVKFSVTGFSDEGDTDSPNYRTYPYIVSAKAKYYKASGAVLTSGFNYDDNLNRVTLKLDGQTQIFREELTANTNTQISANTLTNEYVVKQTVKGVGGATTVTLYTFNGSGVTKTVSTVIPAVKQSKSVEGVGYIKLRSNAIIQDVTLKSSKGTSTETPVITEVSGAKVYTSTVVLSFKSIAAFNNLALSLTYGKNGATPVALSGYTVSSVSGGLVQNGSFFSAPQAGDYSITLVFTNPYGTEVPDSFRVYFDKFTYNTNVGSSKELMHGPDYPNQRVNVVFTSPTKH